MATLGKRLVPYRRHVRLRRPGVLLLCRSEKGRHGRRGENISSFEVERDVMAYPEVQEAAAIAVPGEFADDEIKVFVVVKDESRFDPAQLIEFLIRRMPYFMVPRFIEVVSELPKTETMKTKKHMLRKIGNNDATWDREAAGIVVSRAS
jgi:crotonobetaine/carnitine-CoA ligase